MWKNEQNQKTRNPRSKSVGLFEPCPRQSQFQKIHLVVFLVCSASFVVDAKNCSVYVINFMTPRKWSHDRHSIRPDTNKSIYRFFIKSSRSKVQKYWIKKINQNRKIEGGINNFYNSIFINILVAGPLFVCDLLLTFVWIVDWIRWNSNKQENQRKVRGFWIYFWMYFFYAIYPDSSMGEWFWMCFWTWFLNVTLNGYEPECYFEVAFQKNKKWCFLHVFVYRIFFEINMV